MNTIGGKKLRVIGGIVLAGAVIGATTTMLAGRASAGAASGNQKSPSLAAAAISHKADAGSFDVSNVGDTADKTVLNLNLQAMPAGYVHVDSGGASISMFGLTPGSEHEVALSAAGQTFDVGTLTADSVGDATAGFPMSSLSSAFGANGLFSASGLATDAGDWHLPGIRLEILNAWPGTPAIAQTAPIYSPDGYFGLTGIEPGGYGPLQGKATIIYYPHSQALSVTVNASGLTPGAHAAHIHAGSCQQQGAVVHMLQDFIANGQGVIDNETRTVTGVTSPQLNGGWYLNLHQGNMNNILDGSGNPTIFFRPLLCANI